MAACTGCPPALASKDIDTITLTVVFENDIFAEADGSYTNGARVAWLSGPGAPAWVFGTGRWLPLIPNGATVRTSYEVGQNIYTPEDVELRNPPLDDRPYAGWLYGSTGLPDPRHRWTGLARRADARACSRGHRLEGAAGRRCPLESPVSSK
jgi:lipid A 3-O-deacylase